MEIKGNSVQRTHKGALPLGDELGPPLYARGGPGEKTKQSKRRRGKKKQERPGGKTVTISQVGEITQNKKHPIRHGWGKFKEASDLDDG